MNSFDYFFEHTANLDKSFALSSREEISFADLHGNALTMATYLNRKIGSGKPVLLLSPNSMFFITAYLAILKSGNICVPLNPAIENETIDFIIGKTKASTCFISAPLLKRYNLGALTSINEQQATEIINEENIIANSFPAVDDKTVAEIIFTSGSTGEPKGVMLTHKNLIANTSSIIEYLALTRDDRILVVLPFFYCYGLSLLHTHLRVGGSIALNNSFIFIGSVIKDLEEKQCTGFAGVPSHFQILLRKTTSFKEKTFPYLRYLTQAGGKLHDAFIKEFVQAFPAKKFFVMYGQTEATARLSYLPAEKVLDKLGSIGKAIPGVTLNIVDNDGNILPDGETGEIIAEGDNIMAGYFEDEELTAQTLKNGKLHTGDLARKDSDGYIYVVARKKEIIKVGGKRVSPKEIEEVIVGMPEVIDCTIEGIDDELLGEAIQATIVLQGAVSDKISGNDIKAYCAKHLSKYKIPQVIRFEKNLAVNSTGKKIKSIIKM